MEREREGRGVGIGEGEGGRGGERDKEIEDTENGGHFGCIANVVRWANRVHGRELSRIVLEAIVSPILFLTYDYFIYILIHICTCLSVVYPPVKEITDKTHVNLE